MMDKHDYELYHHGIQGQKWGVTNGPPYPLDASDYSAAEKKAVRKYNRAAKAKNQFETAKDNFKNLGTNRELSAAALAEDNFNKAKSKYDVYMRKLSSESEKFVRNNLDKNGKLSIKELSDSDYSKGKAYYKTMSNVIGSGWFVGGPLLGIPAGFVYDIFTGGDQASNYYVTEKGTLQKYK